MSDVSNELKYLMYRAGAAIRAELQDGTILLDSATQETTYDTSTTVTVFPRALEAHGVFAYLAGAFALVSATIATDVDSRYTLFRFSADTVDQFICNLRSSESRFPALGSVIEAVVQLLGAPTIEVAPLPPEEIAVPPNSGCLSFSHWVCDFSFQYTKVLVIREPAPLASA